MNKRTVPCWGTNRDMTTCSEHKRQCDTERERERERARERERERERSNTMAQTLRFNSIATRAVVATGLIFNLKASTVRKVDWYFDKTQSFVKSHIGIGSG